MRFVGVIFLFFSSVAWAREGAFAQRKVFVNGLTDTKSTNGTLAKASRDYPLLLLVNNTCLSMTGDRLAAIGFSVKHNRSRAMPIQALHASFAGALEDLENILAKESCVIGVTDNSSVTTQAADPLSSDQAFGPRIRQAVGERFFYHPLWGVRAPVVIAAVDSGVQTDHPDLVGRLWRAGDGSYGYDFVNDDTDPSDDFGHGTHVAGLIAAQRDNGVGVRGVMGDQSLLMAVKSQDDLGRGSMADVVNALRWAVDHGAEVVNLSLSSRMQNQALVDALDYAVAKNVTVVVAAGNDGELITTSNFFSPISYASSIAGVIGVGAIDADSAARSSFSNYGSSYVEIAAPGADSAGVGVLSTFTRSDYRRISGTSMASPQVAGAAGLLVGFLKSNRVPFTPAQIESLVVNSGEANLSNQTSFAGGRQLNLERLGRYLFNSTYVSGTGGFDD